MFKVTIIIFRELLEITMLLGAILGIFKDIKRKYVYFGVFLGVLFSFILGALFNIISNSLGGNGGDYCSLFILLSSVVLIYFTLGSVNRTKQNLEKNSKFTTSFVLLVASSILREGMEIFLYTKSILIASSLTVSDILLAFIIGFFGAMFAGYLIFVGINKIPTKNIFKVTSVMLVFIGASFAVSAVNVIENLGFIEIYNFPLWDSSFILSESTFLGTIINIFTGYISKPSFWHIIAYFVTFSILLNASKVLKN